MAERIQAILRENPTVENIDLASSLLSQLSTRSSVEDARMSEIALTQLQLTRSLPEMIEYADKIIKVSNQAITREA
jgi:hypothetical protein